MIQYCYFCDGSGEGLAPDSTCFHCHGKGVEPEEIQEPDREWNDEDTACELPEK